MGQAFSFPAVPKPSRPQIPRPDRALEALAASILSRHPQGTPPFSLLGIANGGIPVAAQLAEILGRKLGRPVPVGVVDVSFYRDDIGQRPVPKAFTPTDIPGEIDGAHLILVDDVLHSGRTVRAALEEVFSQGRPDRVELAVLVDRGDTRLPVRADFVGARLDLPPGATVKVRLDPARPGGGVVFVEEPLST